MKTKMLILYALFAALTAICSMIAIPLPFTPVPVNLATLSVFLAGGLLGARGGAVSQSVYVLLGAIGLPVFSGFTGGFGVLSGPTGGFLVGYAAAAWVTGLIIGGAGHNFYRNIIGMIAGMSVYFTLGTLWFMYVTSTGLIAALMMCVVPFLIGDAFKIAVGSVLVQKLHKVV